MLCTVSTPERKDRSFIRHKENREPIPDAIPIPGEVKIILIKRCLKGSWLSFRGGSPIKIALPPFEKGPTI